MAFSRRIPALAAALFLAAAAPAAAQTVQGRLVDDAGAAIEQVLVVLLDEGGRQRGAALTDVAGGFVLRAPGAGRYRLRAERVGYATTTSEPFALAAGETRTERMVAGGRPVALEGITVEAGARRCDVRPGAGMQTATVWEEARKALNAAAFGQRERLFRYQVVQFQRDLDPRSGRVQREERTSVGALAVHPFASPPPAELSRRGYVQKTPEGVLYYGPDPAVLLSDEFLNDHCLKIADDRRAAGDSLLGVAFEPVRGRDLPEIRGVLWLDRATAQLRRVDYTYTGFPQAVSHERLGGTIEYERLPEGHWIVRRWAIRMPQVEMVQGQRTVPLDNFLRDYENARLAGIREEGGEVASTTTREGRPVLAAAQAATLEGTVWDSTRAAPLAGARVYLSGTGAAAETDAAGRFRMENLGEGSYTVAFSHPELGPLVSSVRPAPVTLAAGKTAMVALAVPGWSTAAAALCPDSTRRQYRGVVLGTVKGAPEGSAPSVTAAWTRTVVGETQRTELRTVSARADPSGFYVLCGVPEERPVRVNAGAGQLASGEREVRVRGEVPLRHDLVLGGATEQVRTASGGGAVPIPGVTGVGQRAFADFERRRRSGRGVFLTRADIERRRPVRTVDLLRGIAGVRILSDPTGDRVEMAGANAPRFNTESLPPRDTLMGSLRSNLPRDANPVGTPANPGPGTAAGLAGDLDRVGGNVSGASGFGMCQVHYYVDGAPFQPVSEGRISDEIPPTLIEAMEIYRNAAETPPEFRRSGSDCGVIVIWTRRRS